MAFRPNNQLCSIASRALATRLRYSGPMGDAERVRVERLLRSGFNAGDVTYLFLYVRDPPIRAQGRETVIDIGGFIAHSGEREKGITTAAANHFTQIARFQVLRISGATGSGGTTCRKISRSLLTRCHIGSIQSF